MKQLTLICYLDELCTSNYQICVVRFLFECDIVKGNSLSSMGAYEKRRSGA